MSGVDIIPSAQAISGPDGKGVECLLLVLLETAVKVRMRLIKKTLRIKGLWQYPVIRSVLDVLEIDADDALMPLSVISPEHIKALYSP